MLLDKRQHGFDPHIAGIARLAALNDGEGLAFVERRLGGRGSQRE